MENYTIAETYTLPSKGKVYAKPVNPEVKIRSMTTEEEMKRLGHSDQQYKLLSEIIDDCLITKPSISSYDMCIGDYQFLLHKLRVVTYGSDYKVTTVCPICGTQNKTIINLDSLNVVEYSEDMGDCLRVTLPKTKHTLDLRLQTPRMLDEIRQKSDDLLAKSSKLVGEPAFLFTLEALIDKVDGMTYDGVKLAEFVRKLPMMDANYILKTLEKINIGIDSNLTHKCSRCQSVFNYTFPFSSEFFGPSID